MKSTMWSALLGAMTLLALPVLASNLPGAADLGGLGAAHAGGDRDKDAEKAEAKREAKEAKQGKREAKAELKQAKREAKMEAKQAKREAKRAARTAKAASGGDGKAEDGGKNVSVIAREGNAGKTVAQTATAAEAVTRSVGGSAGRDGADGEPGRSGAEGRP